MVMAKSSTHMKTMRKFPAYSVLLLMVMVVAVGCSKPKPGTEAYIKEVTALVNDDYLVNADNHPEKGGIIPHLAYSNEGTFSIFEDIVLRGIYLQKGMPNFGDRLNQEDAKNIKSFILHSANELRKAPEN